MATPLMRAQAAAARVSIMAEGDMSVGHDPSSLDLPSPSVELNEAIHDAVRTTLELSRSATIEIAEVGALPANYAPRWDGLDRAERALNRAHTMFLNEMLQYEEESTQQMRRIIRSQLQLKLPTIAISQVLDALGRVQISTDTVDEMRAGIEELKNSMWECVIPDW